MLNGRGSKAIHHSNGFKYFKSYLEAIFRLILHVSEHKYPLADSITGITKYAMI